MNGPIAYAMFPGLFELAQACRNSPRFNACFATEERCREWFRRTRWPNGFTCPRCSGAGRWVKERYGYACQRCRKFTSLTSGTRLHGTRKPLTKWFEAIYLIIQRSVNAKTLQKELGLTYKVAWAWGHKLRGLLAAFAVPRDVRPPRERRHVRYDAERARGAPGPRTPDPGEAGPCGCTKLLQRDWQWPDEIEEERDAERVSRRLAANFAAHEIWPTVPLRAADEPRHGDDRAHHELLATYSGSLSEKHLRAYLDEVAFRLNRRWRAPDEDFWSVAGAAVRAEPRSYKQIVAKASPRGHPMSIYVA